MSLFVHPPAVLVADLRKFSTMLGNSYFSSPTFSSSTFCRQQNVGEENILTKGGLLLKLFTIGQDDDGAAGRPATFESRPKL